MGENVLSGFSIREMSKGKTSVIDNMFSKYRIQSEDEKTDTKIDNLNIGLMVKDAIDDIFDPTSAMTEEEKQNFLDEMQRKIKAGEKLTADEMQYLRMNDPIEYAKMAKVQMQREMLKKQLENCKSKEEVHDVYIEAMSRISDDDPTKMETMAAYNNVYDEFRKSDAYEELPATKDEAEEKEDKDYNVNLDNADDELDNNYETYVLNTNGVMFKLVHKHLSKEKI